MLFGIQGYAMYTYLICGYICKIKGFQNFILADIPCDLFKKPSREYTSDQKDFALTLHLQSPKAYDYLRESVNVSLPHPRTLRR